MNIPTQKMRHFITATEDPRHRSNDWPAYTIMAALILLVAVSVIWNCTQR